MKFVIIPSAKCAPQDVQAIKNIPMVLYPINNKPILDYILSQYSSKDTFYIPGFEYQEKIENYLKNKDEYSVNSFRIPKLKDIGYTILETLNKIQFAKGDELVINFADTLIDNSNLTKNCIVCENKKRTENKWTYFVANSGKIEAIFNKVQESVERNDLKLIVGVMSIQFPADFISILERQDFEEGQSLFKSLMEYSKTHPFDFIEANQWLDLGHPEEFFNSKISVKAREFNHLDFDKNRGILKKTSDEKEKFKGEIEWYLRLPHNLQYVSPRIFDYSLDYNDMYVKMEYYSYPTLLEMFLYSDIDANEWHKVFEKITFLLKDFSQYKVYSDEIRPALYDMYYTKTIQRLDKLKIDRNFSAFFVHPISINGKKYISLNELMNKLSKIVTDNLLDISHFTIIHGDMCFANMLIDKNLNFIKLIDPRGKFGEFDIYGDQRYDIAKLFHSVDGKYDYIINNLFKVSRKGTSIDYSVNSSDFVDIFSIMKEAMSDVISTHLKEIELIEALLFISMIPLHNENVNHQYAMLATGLEIMNRWVNILEK